MSHRSRSRSRGRRSSRGTSFAQFQAARARRLASRRGGRGRIIPTDPVTGRPSPEQLQIQLREETASREAQRVREQAARELASATAERTRQRIATQQLEQQEAAQRMAQAVEFRRFTPVQPTQFTAISGERAPEPTVSLITGEQAFVPPPSTVGQQVLRRVEPTRGIEDVSRPRVTRQRDRTDLDRDIGRVAAITETFEFAESTTRQIGARVQPVVKGIEAGRQLITDPFIGAAQIAKFTAVDIPREIITGRPREGIRERRQFRGFVGATGVFVATQIPVLQTLVAPTIFAGGVVTTISGIRAGKPEEIGRGITLTAGGVSLAPLTIRPIKTRVQRIGKQEIPAEKIFDPQVLAGKEKFPTARGLTDPQVLASFRRERLPTGEIPVVTAAPQRITGRVAAVGKKAGKGFEDPGIFVTPRGRASPLFLRIAGEQPREITFNPFAELGRTFKTPTVTEFRVTGVETLPRTVTRVPGFEAVARFQEQQAGRGIALITKRSQIGRGIIPRQLGRELPTSELEAVIPLGTEFVQRPTKRFTIFEGEFVGLRTADVITTEQIGRVLQPTRVRPQPKGRRVTAEQILEESSLIGRPSRVSAFPRGISTPVSRASSQLQRASRISGVSPGRSLIAGASRIIVGVSPQPPSQVSPLPRGASRLVSGVSRIEGGISRPRGISQLQAGVSPPVGVTTFDERFTQITRRPLLFRAGIIPFEEEEKRKRKRKRARLFPSVAAVVFDIEREPAIPKIVRRLGGFVGTEVRPLSFARASPKERKMEQRRVRTLTQSVTGARKPLRVSTPSRLPRVLQPQPTRKERRAQQRTGLERLQSSFRRLF